MRATLFDKFIFLVARVPKSISVVHKMIYLLRSLYHRSVSSGIIIVSGSCLLRVFTTNFLFWKLLVACRLAVGSVLVTYR